MSQKTAPHLLYGAQDGRVRPEHDCHTSWSTRAPTGKGKTTKTGLVWTSHGNDGDDMEKEISCSIINTDTFIEKNVNKMYSTLTWYAIDPIILPDSAFTL
ncbi:hypothetical protein DPMN_171713 [Dreissena polymorpha]|uniref:Uncharacterized protein n=1 Tax=Dreissena polymorpha TaxID=45954 RepID=A0A9D4E0V7_DREPO|nr:hypothetical protein DPMN_171713 [Dreissena polymorpha]